MQWNANSPKVNNAWKDSESLVLTRGAVLPGRCMRCNSTVNIVLKTISLDYYPNYNLFFGFAGFFLYWRHTVRLQLCDKHLSNGGTTTRAYLLFVIMGALAILAGISSASSTAIIGGSIGVLLGIILFFFGGRTIYIRKIDKPYIWLEGINNDYLSYFPEWKESRTEKTMVRKPVVSESAFNTLLTSLTRDTVTASIHWRLCKDLWGSVPEFIKELNQSPAFWTHTFAAHREVALFRLGRLYDQQCGALSLPRFVDIITSNQHWFDDDRFRERLKDNPFIDSLAQGARRPDESILAEDAARVSEKSDPLVNRLLAIRNRVLAHRDPRVVLGTVPDPSGAIDNADIDTLLDRAATILNRYGVMFRAGSSLMSIVGQDDFRYVLEHVRRDLAAAEERFAAELARAQPDVGG